MNPVENFIYQQPETTQNILLFFHELLVNQYNLTPKYKWKVPMYFGNQWILYLNPDKKSLGVHICFCRGNELSNPHQILESKGRKLVSSILVTNLEELPYTEILQCIEEAVHLDKN